jgi:hypothetical protein
VLLIVLKPINSVLVYKRLTHEKNVNLFSKRNKEKVEG